MQLSDDIRNLVIKTLETHTDELEPWTKDQDPNHSPRSDGEMPVGHILFSSFPEGYELRDGISCR